VYIIITPSHTNTTDLNKATSLLKHCSGVDASSDSEIDSFIPDKLVSSYAAMVVREHYMEQNNSHCYKLPYPLGIALKGLVKMTYPFSSNLSSISVHLVKYDINITTTLHISKHACRQQQLYS